MGTPKTIDGAIENAICVGPASTTADRLYHHIKDLLAQRFGVAYLEAQTPDELARLEKLFKALTERS